MKTNLYLIVLTVLTVALFTSCQDEGFDTIEPYTQTEATDLGNLESDSPAFFKAKGGKGEQHYVIMELRGDILSNGPLGLDGYPARGKNNKLGMQTKYCVPIDLAGLPDLPDLTQYDCFETQLLPVPPDDCGNLTTLTISKGQDGYLYMGYWFKGHGENGDAGPVIDYQIYLRGGNNEFPPNWPLDIAEAHSFTFTSLDLVTKGGKNRNVACMGSWDEGVTHTVTITGISEDEFINWP